MITLPPRYAGLFLGVHSLAGYIKHPWPCSMSRPSQRAFKTGALNASVEEKWRWSYARLIIRQAQSQGGLSFLDYDQAFRQQIASDPSMRWNALNPGLLAANRMGGRSTGARTFCTLCRAVDHTCTQCALAFLEPAQSLTSPAFQPCGANQGVPRTPRSAPICFSWSKGPCQFGSRCKFRHVCSNCVQRPLTKHQNASRPSLPHRLPIIFPAVWVSRHN